MKKYISPLLLFVLFALQSCVQCGTSGGDFKSLSVEEFKEFGMRMEKLTFDLHNSEYLEGNVMTEYEKRFSSMGVPINRVEVYFK